MTHNESMEEMRCRVIKALEVIGASDIAPSVICIVEMENSIAVQEALRRERSDLSMKISDYTVDLCSNSREFKDYVLSLLSSRGKDNQTK